MAINPILQPEHHAVAIFGRGWDILCPTPDCNGIGPNHLCVVALHVDSIFRQGRHLLPLSGFDWEINPPYPDVNVDVHQPNMALVAGPVAEGNVLQRALLVGPNLLCEVLLHARGRDGLRIVAINPILQPEHHAVVIFGRDWDILRPAPDRNGNGPNHLCVVALHVDSIFR